MSGNSSTPSRYALCPEALLRGQQEVLELIAGNAPLKQSLSAIAAFAERSIPDMMASILYFDPVSQTLRCGGFARLPVSFVGVVDGLVPGPAVGSCGTCAYTGERVISPDVYADPAWRDYLWLCDECGIRSAWSTPLKHSRDGSLVGVFGMYFPVPKTPSTADLEFVDHFTHLAKIAVERHRDDERQRQLALTDALTGLGNRHLLQTAGLERIRRARSEGAPLSVAFIDLDKFKPFNDLFGHIEGDALLRKIAAEMSRALAPFELLVRFGGDEFIAFFSENVARAQVRIEAFQSALAQGLEVGSTRACMTFSCGLTELSPDDADLDLLIFRADEAARQAKQQGGDRCCVTDAGHAERAVMRRRIAQRLSLAIDRGDIEPHLQPIVDLASGEPVAFEMLFRSKDPVLQAAGAAECISVAEETGLIHRLGVEMLDAACALLTDPSRPLRNLSLNVNLSVLQLMRTGFVDEVRDMLQRRRADPRRISLELTESHWLDLDGPAHDAMLALRALGFRMALDDFGAGYASLTYLQSLPFDAIKIDRRFIRSLDEDRNGRALCTAMLAMGKACGMHVVAEGVETKDQARALAEIGYSLGQGYLWSRPMSYAAAQQWLDQTLAAA